MAMWMLASSAFWPGWPSATGPAALPSYLHQIVAAQPGRWHIGTPDIIRPAQDTVNFVVWCLIIGSPELMVDWAPSLPTDFLILKQCTLY